MGDLLNTENIASPPNSPLEKSKNGSEPGIFSHVIQRTPFCIGGDQITFF